MPSQTSVCVHQSSSGSSAASSSSRSSSSATHYVSSTARPELAREYNAKGRLSEVVRSGNNSVINHHKTDFERGSPSPGYRGGY